MDRDQEEIHVTTEEARAGSTPHIVRYVLFISLFLAIAALSAIWITGAFTSSERSAQAVAQSAVATEAAGDVMVP